MAELNLDLWNRKRKGSAFDQLPSGAWTRGNQTMPFEEWTSSYADMQGINPDPFDPNQFYDYQGAYDAGTPLPGPGGHLPSQFKLPGHPNQFVNGIDTITGLPQTDLGSPETIPTGLPSIAGAKPTIFGVPSANIWQHLSRGLGAMANAMDPERRPGQAALDMFEHDETRKIAQERTNLEKMHYDILGQTAQFKMQEWMEKMQKQKKESDLVSRIQNNPQMVKKLADTLGIDEPAAKDLIGLHKGNLNDLTKILTMSPEKPIPEEILDKYDDLKPFAGYPLKEVRPLLVELIKEKNKEENKKPEKPLVHSFIEGEQHVDKQWNPETLKWETLSRGPRHKPPSEPKAKISSNIAVNPTTGKEEYLMTDGSFSGKTPGAKPKAEGPKKESENPRHLMDAANYKTADDVKKDFDAGKITKEKAIKILKDKFKDDPRIKE